MSVCGYGVAQSLWVLRVGSDGRFPAAPRQCATTARGLKTLSLQPCTSTSKEKKRRFFVHTPVSAWHEALESSAQQAALTGDERQSGALIRSNPKVSYMVVVVVVVAVFIYITSII